MPAHTTACLLAAVTLGIASAAEASLSPVQGPPPGEKSVAQILGQTYGGSFSLSGNDYTNGSITAVRIDDFLAGGQSTNLINLNSGPRDDRFWSDGIALGSARARWAGYSQSFGYFDGHSGGTYHNLFDVVGSGYGVSGDAEIDFGAELGNPAHWRWARTGDGGTWSSNPADNGSTKNDHLVTYLITGVSGDAESDLTRWMLFWEDLDLGDKDYNDLAVEVVARPSGDNQITAAMPEPMTATASLMGMAALGARLTRRRHD